MTMVRDYERLTKADVPAFDQEALKLLCEMQDAGWRGRVSVRGHAILYAPDGVTTAAFARSSLRGRSGRNARATFERWKRAQRGEGE
ncbi:hypothetical protein HOT31_gp117 [Microbacterium phage Hendrix]|uniref:Uncharacterized protein n=1 Tax=Microbacterium phage Hendrix TaxID=2182341 RepID=A0A2U8UUE1_9CAUD|nr:hypothetical protein HOT31_gp117 [Microbacterium phage Hendrix]AWN07788.1 hypothetical protein PBI_HENDRIX_117 [Microbacterium phage Hendrix]